MTRSNAIVTLLTSELRLAAQRLACVDCAAATKTLEDAKQYFCIVSSNSDIAPQPATSTPFWCGKQAGRGERWQRGHYRAPLCRSGMQPCHQILVALSTAATCQAYPYPQHTYIYVHMFVQVCVCVVRLR